jgi:hypothetical protein
MSSLPFRVSVLRVLAACALVGIGAGADAGCARAQGISMPGSGMPGSGLGMQGSAPTFSGEQLDRSLRGQRRPPSALPGATKTQPIAPPSQVPTLMSPTDALFDAVNRGDMAGVRDAIGRGADLSARNELGLTPLDLAIDLGRSDISFLLLSMRGATPAPSAGPQELAQAAKPQEATGPARTKGGRHLTTRATIGSAGEPSLPRLFAGNGGDPIPGAGFLGFDGH